MKTRYILQDGPDFYVFGDADAENPLDVVTYPDGISGDFDMVGAKEARVWFVERAASANISPVFMS